MLVSDPHEAWRRYVSTGALDRRLLRPAVLHAWERSHEAGADPSRPRAEHLSADDTERLRARESRLITAAEPYMRALSRAAGSERHAAMLGSADAVVLDVTGHPESVRGPEAVPGPGSLLSESACGSNGIGTPLADGGYAELVGPEHFISGFHPFTCQGVPLRAPDGSVAGVLSISVRRVQAARQLHELLGCAVRGIEAELVMHQLAQEMERLLRARPGDAETLDRVRQDVAQAMTSGRLRLDAAARRAHGHDIRAHVEMLWRAEHVFESFMRRAEYWRDVADDTASGPVLPVRLTDEVVLLVELLQTEAETRGVELGAASSDDPEWTVDRRALRRQLFRAVHAALESCPSGSRVEVRVAQPRGAPGPRIAITRRDAAVPVGTLDLDETAP